MAEESGGKMLVYCFGGKGIMGGFDVAYPKIFPSKGFCSTLSPVL